VPQPYAAHRLRAQTLRPRPHLSVVGLAVTALVALTACSSSTGSSTPTGTRAATATATATASAAPTGPLGSAADQAVLDTITVGTAASGIAPTITLPTTPVSVSITSRKILTPGGGALSAIGGLVRANILLVKASDGTTLDSTYEGSPQSFALNPKNYLPGLANGLAGLNLGSRILLAIPASEGFGTAGRPDLGISGTETLVMVVDIVDVANAIPQATGTPVAPVTGQPTVTFDPTTGPTITIPAGAAAPTTLVNQNLIEGSGTKVTEGMFLQVHYTGVLWKDGSVFDSSWPRAQYYTFQTGTNSVIPAWDKGLVGHTVGSRVLLVVPPADGYGPDGNPPKIAGTDTLVFVVDILAAA
jgi:peptidylprolyl isomerase